MSEEQRGGNGPGPAPGDPRPNSLLSLEDLRLKCAGTGLSQAHHLQGPASALCLQSRRERNPGKGAKSCLGREGERGTRTKEKGRKRAEREGGGDRGKDMM